MENCSMKELFGDVIYSYTRAQAIDDGVLIDVTEMARQAGIKHPTAITASVFDDYVHVPKALEGMQDEQGRLWDILWMFAWHVKIGEINGNEGMFEVSFLTYEAKGPNDIAKSRNETVMLKAVCGPNDDASPCITIMLPDED